MLWHPFSDCRATIVAAKRWHIVLAAISHVEIIRAVWSHLRCSATRPTVTALAQMLGLPERTLRRRLRISGRPPARDIITFAAVAYAALMISQGTKVEAAMLMAGFRNKTNFCVQFRTWLGCRPGE